MGGIIVSPSFLRSQSMKMSEIRSKGYQVFPGLESRSLSNQVASLKYIESLATETGINISSWDVLTIFKQEEGRVHTDKKKINQLFFLQAKSVPQVAENNPWVGRAHELESILLTRSRARIERDLQRAWADYDVKAEELKAKLRRVANTYSTYLTAFNQSPVSIANQLYEIEQQGFWRVESLERSDIVFQTTAPVVITRVNTSAGINDKVNLGILRMIVHLENAYVEIEQVSRDDYEFPWNYPHPNVSTSKEPCLGNLRGDVDQALVSFDITKLCHLFQAFLTQNGEHGHPYRSISEFAYTYRVRQVFYHLFASPQRKEFDASETNDAVLFGIWRKSARDALEAFAPSFAELDIQTQNRVVKKLVMLTQFNEFGSRLASEGSVSGIIMNFTRQRRKLLRSLTLKETIEALNTPIPGAIKDLFYESNAPVLMRTFSRISPSNLIAEIGADHLGRISADLSERFDHMTELSFLDLLGELDLPVPTEPITNEDRSE